MLIIISNIFIIKSLIKNNKSIKRRLDSINNKIVKIESDNIIIRRRTLKAEMLLEGLHHKITYKKTKKKSKIMIIVVIFFIIIMMIMFYMLNKIIDLSAKVSECERKSGERYRSLLYRMNDISEEVKGNFNKIVEVQETVNVLIEKDSTKLSKDIVSPPVEVEDRIKSVTNRVCDNKRNKKNKKSNNTNN